MKKKAAKKKTIKKSVKKVVKKATEKKTAKRKSVKKTSVSKKAVKKKTAKKTVKKITVRTKLVKKTVAKKTAGKQKVVKKAAEPEKKISVSSKVKKQKTDSKVEKILKETKDDLDFAARIPKAAKVVKPKLPVEEDNRPRELTPMRIYLNQIEKIPLLTPDEELELSCYIQEKKDGWKQARRRMIRCNLRLVINIAKRYMNLGLPFSDLVEEGNIGLMRAVDKFNYQRGYRFSTYASWWIKQAMMRALSNQGKLIRIPVHMFESMSKWRKVRDYLMQKSGRLPSSKEIAKLMKVSVAKVKEIEHAAKTYPSSLHAPVSIDGDAELIDLIEDDRANSPNEEAHDVFKGERINEFFKYVNEREKTILIMRFGLFDCDRHTLEETAQQFGITRERVRQIEEAALKKIRTQLEMQNDKLENYI